MLKEINEAEIYNVIKNKEFEKSIINSKKNVAVVMSQSWCWQWRMVNEWLPSISDIDDLDVYTIVYDNKKYYNDFLSFKENVFGNYEVPYIRYYAGGKLIKETNFISKESFLEIFNIKN